MLISLDLLLLFEPWVPVIDNILVHGQLYETVQNTSFPLKPLIIGTLTEEAVLFVYAAWNKTLTAELYSGVVLAFFKSKAVKVLEHFPPVIGKDQRLLFSRILTQWVFACTNRIFARKAASYSYVFGFPYDYGESSPLSFCNEHVCHAGEIPYLFQARWVNFTDAGRRVSQSIATYWTNFAKSQNPNEPIRTLTPWPKVATGNETYLYFQDPVQVEENYLKDDCDFWDTIGYKKEYF